VAAVRDEISELAQLLNQMFDRLESAFDQITTLHGRGLARTEDPDFLDPLQA